MVEAGADISGGIRFMAPANSPHTCHSATLVIEASADSRVEVPIQFIIGSIMVEVLDTPIEVTVGESVPFSVRVTPSWPFDVELTLSADALHVVVPPQSLKVTDGSSVTTSLTLHARRLMDPGQYTETLWVKWFSDMDFTLPFEVRLKKPVPPPELEPDRAIDLIHQHYLRTGGRLGPLGYPTSEVRVSSYKATRQYRGGQIEATLNARDSIGVITQALKTQESRVTFLGFRCIRESEHDGLSGTDEPYFVIAVDTGNGVPLTKKFGPFENTETGRETGVGAFLVNGNAPNPLSIRVEAYEHDHGDPDETARAIQEQMVELAQAAQSIASGSGADAADGPGIGPAATAGAVGLLAGPLGALLAVGVVSVLGLGDDWIGQGVALAFTRPEQAKTPPPLGTFQGNPFNAKIDINGGPEGHYELFFDIHVKEVEQTTL
ncbi:MULTISPECIES: hypothetical protein [unclassified Mesorhizobium]|uniref:COG1470 family protein n=1 Tax=unclassified Mesorhizobium TaxID=325217 RepID=UPI003334BB30